MGDHVVNRLSSVPWARALINDPKWTSTRTDSRLPKGSGEDSFFAETLATNRTIRALLTLRLTKEEGDDFPVKEIVTIIDLGDGLNGHPRIAHGGFAATMLDEYVIPMFKLHFWHELTSHVRFKGLRCAYWTEPGQEE